MSDSSGSFKYKLATYQCIVIISYLFSKRHIFKSECDGIQENRFSERPDDLSLIPGPATYSVSSSADSRRAVVSYWQKYVHEVLVNSLGGLSLPRKSVLRLNDRPDMTLVDTTLTS